MKRTYYDSEATSGSEDENSGVGACFGGNWITSWMAHGADGGPNGDNRSNDLTGGAFVTRQSPGPSFFLPDKAPSKRAAAQSHIPLPPISTDTGKNGVDFGIGNQFLRRMAGGTPGTPAHSKRDSGTTTATTGSSTSGDDENMTDATNAHAASVIATDGQKRDSTENLEDTTALIAQEMNSLSLVEREEAYEDLHGVAASVEETPKLLQSSLDEMERFLDHHLGLQSQQSVGLEQGEHVVSSSASTLLTGSASESASAYSIAHAINYQYCHNRNLRLMFLRADKFNVEKAAERLIKWFDWKLQLFGKDKLCQTIRLSDLDKDDIQTIQYGLLQILPSRDSRGRIVFMNAPTYFKDTFRTSESGIKTLYYMVMSAMEDVNSQRSGSVLVFYGLGPEKSYNPRKRELFLKATKLISALPWRLDAVHFCVPSPVKGANSSSFIIGPFVALIQNSIGKHFRARFRVHCGSHTECQYALLTFGLPSTLLPITSEGQELKRTNHVKWFKRRKAKEKQLAIALKKQSKIAMDLDMGLHDGEFDESLYFNGVDLPSQLDVLLGRGKPLTEHAGNRRLDELVRAYYNEYNATTGKGNHAALSYKLVRIIQNEGGRFLKKSDEKSGHGWWEPVSNEEATDKVGHAFRTKRGSQTKQQILLSQQHQSGGGANIFQKLPYATSSSKMKIYRATIVSSDDGSGSSSSKILKLDSDCR